MIQIEANLKQAVTGGIDMSEIGASRDLCEEIVL
jgi:hypothetical protein